MKISDLLNETRINLSLKGTSKAEVIKELVDMLENDGKLIDREIYEQAVFKREDESTTGIGMGVAIPHGKSSGVKEPAIAFGRSDVGIDFKALDGKPSKIFFIIAVPESSSNLHLDVLKQLSRSLMHQEVRDKLMQVQNFEQILKIFD